MRQVSHFKRAIAMFAAIRAAVAEFGQGTQLNLALARIGPYRSRGHGGARAHHPSRHFVAMDKRAAQKARNRKR